jgi:hypothetical protein
MFNKVREGVDDEPGSRDAEAASVVIAARRGTRAFVEGILAGAPDLDVVGSVGSRAAAGDALRRLAPDVAVIEVCLVCVSEFILQGWGPVSRATRLVIVGHEDSTGLARRLVAMGAIAYVPLGRAPDELADAVRAASRHTVATPDRGWHRGRGPGSVGPCPPRSRPPRSPGSSPSPSITPTAR